jgi:uncharacterized OB-fold protein
MHGGFPLPDVDWEPTRELFAAAARGELRITRCDSCRRYLWYPETPCRHCGGSDLTWSTVSGRGTLFSWSVIRYPWIPQFASLVPFVTGLVALAEDPRVRMVTRIVGCAPEDLRCDLPVTAVFRPLRFEGVSGEVVVPMFQPVKS